MTAIGGKLSEAGRAVGATMAPCRVTRRAHRPRVPQAGSTASDGEPPLPQRAMTMGRRARVAKCLAAGARWSRPRGWPGRGDVFLRQRRAVTSGNIEAQAASLHMSPRSLKGYQFGKFVLDFAQRLF
jgi:hypothetical protein